MKRGQPYTTQEDSVIIETVKSNPHNLNDAFILASRLLPARSNTGIAMRYYTKLRNIIPMLATGNDKILLVNTKNTVSTIDNSYFNAVMRDKMLTGVFNTLPHSVLVDFFMDNVSDSVKADLFKKVTSKLKR